MQAFLGILQFLLILQRVPAQMSELQKEKVPTTVIPFSEVMAKSKCQPMEHLVYVYHEFPESVDTIYIPDCVVLRRCSGYITDEAKGCYPTLERNITLQLVLFSVQQPVVGKQPVVELTFVEHQSCEHRPRQNLQNYERPVINSNSKSIKSRPSRRNHKKTAVESASSLTTSSVFAESHLPEVKLTGMNLEW